jgi:hypothetical protein
MTIKQFVIATLAAYRISRMITREDGPFDALSWIRGKVDPNQKSWVGRGLACIACVSFWVSLVIAIVSGYTWLEWLAVASGVMIVNREMER